jgi:hypothetical protein
MTGQRSQISPLDLFEIFQVDSKWFNTLSYFISEGEKGLRKYGVEVLNFNGTVPMSRD